MLSEAFELDRAREALLVCDAHLLEGHQYCAATVLRLHQPRLHRLPVCRELQHIQKTETRRRNQKKSLWNSKRGTFLEDGTEVLELRHAASEGLDRVPQAYEAAVTISTTREQTRRGTKGERGEGHTPLRAGDVAPCRRCFAPFRAVCKARTASSSPALSSRQRSTKTNDQ